MSTIIKSDTAKTWLNRSLYQLDSPVLPAGVWWTERNGNTLGVRNLADVDLQPASPIGTPTEAAGYTVYGNPGGSVPNNGMQTDVVETAAMTALLVFRSRGTYVNDNNKPMFLGNYNYAGSRRGFMIAAESATQIRAFADFNNTSTSTIVNSVLVANSQVNSSWAAIAVVVDDNAGIKLYNLTDATRDAAQAAAFPRAPGPLPMRVGIASGQGYYGQCDIAFSAIIPAALTRAQCATAMARPRLYLNEQLGIVT